MLQFVMPALLRYVANGLDGDNSPLPSGLSGIAIPCSTEYELRGNMKFSAVQNGTDYYCITPFPVEK